MKNTEPNFFAVIPTKILFHDRLIPKSILLYGAISSLTKETGYCWAKDSYFAKKFNVSKTTVQNWLKSLEEFGFIHREVIYKEGSKEILDRYIRIIENPTQENLRTPTQENLRDNNKSFNNKNDKKSNKKKSKQTYDDSSEYMKLAKRLHEKILSNNEIDKPDLQDWANDMRLMVEKDNRPIEYVIKVIDYSQSNHFWKKNILSAAKLREKYITLKAQLPNGNNGNDKNNMFSGINLTD